ncbi:MAG: ribulose-phosphate 3-epimerase [Myxococcales bacterium]|nr:ribulose-phosphate 3-epimerase [Myxococcales bacterium]
MSAPRIAPSILSADFSRLGAEVEAVAAAGADWIHLDVMDGHFVPNLTFGPPVVKAIRGACTLPFDVHLMITDPDRYAPAFRDAGADLITVHAEASVHLHRTLQLVRSTGAKVGVSLNPHTPLSVLDHVLDQVDLVLLMSVNPGFGGQHFIPAVLDKIRRLRARIDAEGFEVDIEVDGGINSASVFKVAQAGADVFVAGSAVFGNGNYGSAIDELRRLAREGQQARGGA